MAKSKSRTRKKPVYSKIKNPVKPRWMRVLRLIAIIFCSLLLLLGLAGKIVKYYRLVSKH